MRKKINYSNLIKLQFSKYLLISLTALGLDYSIYYFLAKFHTINLPEASAAGYLTGFIYSYFMYLKLVFKDRVQGLILRCLQFLLYILSGFLGMFITFNVTKISLFLNLQNIHIIKIIAISLSFICVYFFRINIVFNIEKFFKLKV